jgi:hypothetical protein
LQLLLDVWVHVLQPAAGKISQHVNRTEVRSTSSCLMAVARPNTCRFNGISSTSLYERQVLAAACPRAAYVVMHVRKFGTRETRRAARVKFEASRISMQLICNADELGCEQNSIARLAKSA